MSILLISFIQAGTWIALLAGGGLGLLAGFALCRRHARGSKDERHGGSQRADSQEEVGREYAQEVLLRLHEASATVVETVRAYQERIEAVAESLESCAEGPKKKRQEATEKNVETMRLANSEIQRQMAPAMREIEEYALEIESQMAEALTDATTGIPNRKAFDQELWRRFAEWKSQHTPFSVMLIDTDHFQKLYSQYGAAGGDMFLRRVSEAISGTLREMDLVSRFSPGALGAILPGTDLQEAIRTAERVRAALEDQRFEHQGTTHTITISVGLAESNHGDNAASLLRRADAALFAAKEGGRNCVFANTGACCESAAAALDKLASRNGSESTSTNKGQADLWLPGTESDIDETGTFASALDPRIDALTGLPNRQSFSEALRPRLAEWRRQKTPLSLLLVAIDDLELLDERSGAGTGDVAIRAVPRFLAAAMRETDLVARFDEDKFVVLLPRNDATAATIVGERIRTAIESCETLKHRKSVVRFTASVGVVEASDNDSAVALVMRAESALRAARDSGTNRTYLHDGESCQPARAEAPVEVAAG